MWDRGQYLAHRQSLRSTTSTVRNKGAAKITPWRNSQQEIGPFFRLLLEPPWWLSPSLARGWRGYCDADIFFYTATPIVVSLEPCGAEIAVKTSDVSLQYARLHMIIATEIFRRLPQPWKVAVLAEVAGGRCPLIVISALWGKHALPRPC